MSYIYMHNVNIIYHRKNRNVLKPHVCLSNECKYDMNIYDTDIFRQNKTFMARFGYTLK